jgi:NADH dehydrogenase (ubiquinone) 1 alpha subcomplex subunit 8
MATYHDPTESAAPYKDPTPMPAHVPAVQELGTTSGPLKSAAFFIGAYCKDYNGPFPTRLDAPGVG